MEANELKLRCPHCDKETIYIAANQSSALHPERSDAGSTEPGHAARCGDLRSLLPHQDNSRSKKAQAPRGPIEAFEGFSASFKEAIHHVPQKTQLIWLELYEDRAWIKLEILSAQAWLENHPKRLLKDKGRFFTNWLKSASGDRKPAKKNNHRMDLE